MTVSEELTWRGFVHQTTFEKPSDLDKSRTFYFGVDPSAKSMHIGNLAQVMVAKILLAHGFKAIVLVGGATGMIGDPKLDTERELKSLDEIDVNKRGIAAQYQALFDGQTFEFVDNYQWFKDIGYLNFLRDVGKHFSMTQLLDRDFVKSRIGEGSSGISYAEFSYSLIQGYDYLHLSRTKGASLQIGGSDQWGNMLSGAQMIRKLDGGDAHVWTVPLVLDKSTGKKFGKSEGNAVWLDPEMTSPFKFYQFWLNVDDESVIDYLKMYTLLSQDDIANIEHDSHAQRGARIAQKRLAREVTSLVHGAERARQVEQVTDVLFGGVQFASLNDDAISLLADEVQTTTMGTLINILVSTSVASSKGEAKRLLAGGAVQVNGDKVLEDQDVATRSLIKKGKNTFILVR